MTSMHPEEMYEPEERVVRFIKQDWVIPAIHRLMRKHGFDRALTVFLLQKRAKLSEATARALASHWEKSFASQARRERLASS